MGKIRSIWIDTNGQRHFLNKEWTQSIKRVVSCFFSLDWIINQTETNLKVSLKKYQKGRLTVIKNTKMFRKKGKL